MDKEKVASIIAKALKNQGGSNEHLPDGTASSATPSSGTVVETLPTTMLIHFERADRGLGLSIAGNYYYFFTFIETYLRSGPKKVQIIIKVFSLIKYFLSNKNLTSPILTLDAN